MVFAEDASNRHLIIADFPDGEGPAKLDTGRV
jgi:hypothetical protein